MEKCFDSLSQRISVAENLVKYLLENPMESTSSTRKTLSRNSSEKDYGAFEVGKKRKLAPEEEESSLRRQNFFEMKQKVLDEHLVPVTEHVEWLGVTLAGDQSNGKKLEEDLDSRELKLRAAEELLAERERKVSMIIETLDERINAVEEKERKFNLFLEGNMREMELKEEQLLLKWEDFAVQVKLADAKFRQQEKLRNAVLKKLELAENKLETMRADMDTRFKEVELRENAAWESVAISVNEADLIWELMGKLVEEFEKMKSEYNTFQKDKMRELDSKEQQLNEINEELVKSATLRNDQLIARERSVNQLFKKLELAKGNVEGLKDVVDKRFKKVLMKEIELNSQSDWIEKKMDEIDSKAKEFEKRKSEFNSFQEDKMRKLDSKEQLLNEINEELVESATLRNDQLIERESSVNQLLKKLEFAKDNVESLKVVVDVRFKKALLKEIELNSLSDWIEKKLDEIDTNAQEFEKMKSEFNSFQEDKMRELDSKEQLLNEINEELVKSATLRNDQLIEQERSVNQLLKKLELAKDNVEGLKVVVDERFKKVLLKEIELNSQSDLIEKKMDEIDAKAKELEEKDGIIKMKEDKRMNKEIELTEREKTLDKKDKNLKSVGEFINSCFKKYLAKKRKLLLEEDLVEKTARFLGIKEESLEHALRELGFREKQMRDHGEEQELKHQRSSEPDESVDIKFTVRMDGKNLQMFLNDSEKDLESMSDEIFKVLHLSSDPAKLVLDALEGFYPPHLRDGDMVFSVRRTCISLLKQLVRMSSKIKPHVREEAFRLASTWMSKIRSSAGNTDPLEVLGFLFLLAAYNLASCFRKDDITSLLKMVAQHREAPELYCILGFRWSTTAILEDEDEDELQQLIPLSFGQEISLPALITKDEIPLSISDSLPAKAGDLSHAFSKSSKKDEDIWKMDASSAALVEDDSKKSQCSTSNPTLKTFSKNSNKKWKSVGQRSSMTTSTLELSNSLQDLGEDIRISFLKEMSAVESLETVSHYTGDQLDKVAAQCLVCTDKSATNMRAFMVELRELMAELENKDREVMEVASGLNVSDAKINA